tara:strand:+ start:3793 stop:4161 length:369 start_codon:yes stop_codon:yes gene_type:complete
MIQGVISRMSMNSGTIKRYAVVISAAAVSFAKFAKEPMILWLSMTVVILFALLDARYLRLERCYRDLFDIVRTEPASKKPDFRLTPAQDGHSICVVLYSWSVLGLYGAMILFMLAAIRFVGK